MKIQELVTSPVLVEDTPYVVLMKMATTIDPSISNLNGYTNRSCFGAVAHYLKTHSYEPSWYILLFGFKDNNEVTHCCLYDEEGNEIVDTFNGHPANTPTGLYYVDEMGNKHALLASLTVRTFVNDFLTK